MSVVALETCCPACGEPLKARVTLGGFFRTVFRLRLFRILNHPDNRKETSVSDADDAVELPREDDLSPRRWRLPSGTIVFEAVNHDAVRLLKTNPGEYFRRTRDRSRASAPEPHTQDEDR